MIVIGVDNGNANTKTSNFIFETGIKISKTKPVFDNEIIKFKDNYYSLTNRSTYQKDKTENENAFILTLFGISKEILKRKQYKEDSAIEVALGVGLPLEHFATLREDFRRYFLKNGETINYEYNDKPFIIKLKFVEVFLQCFSATFLVSKQIEEFSTIFIVDIGGYTVDIFKFENSMPKNDFVRSINKGAIHMNNKIISEINTDFNEEIEEHHIKSVLIGDRKTILSDEIINQIKEKSKTFCIDLINTLSEQNVNLKNNPAIFLGGGSLLFKDYLQKSDLIKYPIFIENICANAIGYETLLGHKINSQSNNK